MMRRYGVLGLLVLLMIPAMTLAAEQLKPREVTFMAADSVTIVGDLYQQSGEKAPVVLLFHQAGANARAEYETIIPRLIEHGYSVLAIDQRSGGNRLGGVNRTVGKLKTQDLHYCEAYPDLEAALQYAKRHLDGPVFVWGSSYSAALVIQLGVDHQDAITGVLAFSPASGEPMKSCDPTEAIKTIAVPLLALRPAQEMEYESVKTQFDLLLESGHQGYVSANGVHGSSMLNPHRVEGGVENTWKAVFGFIDSLLEN